MHREQMRDDDGDYVDIPCEDDVDEFEDSNLLEGVNDKHHWVHASDVGISGNISEDYDTYGTQKESYRQFLNEELVNVKQWNIRKGKARNRVRPDLDEAYRDLLRSLGDIDE